MVGLSAGSGLLARFFGEESELFLGGVGVCPGFNIEKCMGRFGFPYQVRVITSLVVAGLLLLFAACYRSFYYTWERSFS